MRDTISFSPVVVGVMRLGDWGVKMTENELERFIDECVELGIRDFDHADIYGFYTAEEEFGAVLRRRKDLRHKIQLTTKCGIKMVCENRPTHKIKSYDSTKAHILASAENSLKNLHVDNLDLLLLHRPDMLMDPDEIAEAFTQLKKEGKVKHFGVSNFTPSQFDLINSATPLVTNQIELSLLHLHPLTDGTLDQCLKHKIQPMIWSPLGGGALFMDTPDARIDRIKKVAQPLAEKYQVGLDQILLAFVQKHPTRPVPVLGTSKVERVKAALAAKDIKLTHEEWYDLYQASTGEEIA